MHLEYSLPFFRIPWIFSTFVFCINASKIFSTIAILLQRKKNKEINRKKIYSGQSGLYRRGEKVRDKFARLISKSLPPAKGNFIKTLRPRTTNPLQDTLLHYEEEEEERMTLHGLLSHRGNKEGKHFLPIFYQVTGTKWGNAGRNELWLKEARLQRFLSRNHEKQSSRSCETRKTSLLTDTGDFV